MNASSHLSTAQVKVALAARLPDDLGNQLDPLAVLLAALLGGSLTPQEAEARLLAADFVALRERLAGQRLTVNGARLDFAADGDHIQVGAISQAEGVAIGRGASAQVVRGDGNIDSAGKPLRRGCQP